MATVTEDIKMTISIKTTISYKNSKDDLIIDNIVIDNVYSITSSTITFLHTYDDCIMITDSSVKGKSRVYLDDKYIIDISSRLTTE